METKIKLEECDSCGKELVEIEYDVSESGIYGGLQRMIGPVNGSESGNTREEYGEIYFQLCPKCAKKKNPLGKMIRKEFKNTIENNSRRIQNSMGEISMIEKDIEELKKENRKIRRKLHLNWEKSDYIVKGE